MKQIPCIAEPGEFGDCWRACIASILDLCATEVPNFFHEAGAGTPEVRDSNKGAYALAREWLTEHGLSIYRTCETGKWSLEKLLAELHSFSPGVPIILHGMPARPHDEAHAVVVLDGEIAWDPSGAGISGPVPCDCGDESCEGWWWLDVISPGANWAMGDFLP